ncbi:uncharacterized protein [Rhodnius prolixus]|uniref:uncharacterized protein n=1 Tax=Rhodnius prolixus TaxID=13249 RepID=UPI003D18B487
MNNDTARCKRPSYNCDGCHKNFASIISLTRHKVDCKYYQCIYECPYCDFTSSLKGFKKHVVNVHSKQVIIQEESVKSPSLEPERPGTSESKTVTYQPLVLPASTILTSSLPLYKCVGCHKCFKTVDILSEHTVDCKYYKYVFKCPHCEFTSRLEGFKRHVAQVHGKQVIVAKGIKKFSSESEFNTFAEMSKNAKYKPLILQGKKSINNPAFSSSSPVLQEEPNEEADNKVNDYLGSEITVSTTKN